MSKKVGIITIGQSPRPDVVPRMAELIGDRVTIVERGALDGLNREEIAGLAPEGDQFRLVTRLRDGSEVPVAKEKILPLMAQAVKEVDEQNVDLILLLCNGAFPRFQARALVVEPQKVVDRSIEALVRDDQKLGVIVPVAEQEAWVRESLAHVTPHISVAVASPYSDPELLRAVGERFKQEECHLVVLYCMGFNRDLGRRARRLSGRPVLVSSSTVARLVGELMEE